MLPWPWWVVVALVCAIDLVRTGSLPTPSAVLYFTRLFGSQGYGMIPMPVLGLHLALYATFAGALIVAAVRARTAEADRGLTALLGFAGAFGLLVLVYYGGRSNAYSLIGVFPAWGLALALLTWLVVGRVRTRRELAGRRAAGRRARDLCAGRIRARGDHGDRDPGAVAAGEPARRLLGEREPLRPRGGRELRRRARRAR